MKTLNQVFKMRSFAVLLSVLAVIVSAQNTSCTSEIYGTVENGQIGYGPCDLSLDGFRSAVCTNGQFGEDDTTHCVPRTITIFSYGIDSFTLKVGETLPDMTLYTDGEFTSYTIAPELPEGLSFNTANAVISGSPSEAIEATEFVISGVQAVPTQAYNVTLTLTVETVVCAALDSFPETANGQIAESTNACPAGYSGTAKRTCVNGFFSDLDTSSCTQNAPSSFFYSQSSVSVNRLEHMIVVPSITGVVTSYSVSPSLPTGLTLNQATGTISGIPTVVYTQGYYTVTATGPGGSTTATISITVTEAKCSGLVDGSGSNVEKTHNANLEFSCGEGYTGTWSYRCNNGVYTDKNDGFCIPTKPTGFSYAKTDYHAYLGETINTGIPTISGVVLYYESNSLPEGFTLDAATGIITGSSNIAIDVSVTVTAVANELFQSKATTYVHIVVSDVECEATADYKKVANGGSSTYKCPEGYEGEMKRKCKNINNVGVFDYADVHCQKVQDYTFFIICCGILVVCVIILLVGVCVKSGRSRAKNQKKNLQKAAKTPAAKPAAKPVAKPVAAKKVAI